MKKALLLVAVVLLAACGTKFESTYSDLVKGQAIPAPVLVPGTTYSVKGVITQTGQPIAGNSLSKVKIKDTFCAVFTLAKPQNAPGRVVGTAVKEVSVEVGGARYIFQPAKHNNPGNDYVQLVEEAQGSGQKMLVVRTAHAATLAMPAKGNPHLLLGVVDSSASGRDLSFEYQENYQAKRANVKGHITTYGTGC